MRGRTCKNERVGSARAAPSGQDFLQALHVEAQYDTVLSVLQRSAEYVVLSYVVLLAGWWMARSFRAFGLWLSLRSQVAI